MAKEAGKNAEGQIRRYGWASIFMLLIVMVSLSTIFIWGLNIMVNDMSSLEAVDIVAIVSPALAAVGTVAAGIFGYSLGSQSTSEAQQTATRITQEMSAEREKAADTTKAATPLVDSVQRIVQQAQAGAESEPGKRNISLDDLNTLRDMADKLAARVGQKA